MARYTVAYRLWYVDHMDVTVDYETGLEAITEFEKVKQYASLKFVRLECDGETVEFFSLPDPYSIAAVTCKVDPGPSF